MATISRSGIAASSTISATHITNIIDALDGTGATTIIATGSFSGSLVGTSSWASNASSASLAATATTANGVVFSGITSLPAGISVSGVAAVSELTGSVTASSLVNGTFYSVTPSTNAVSILLNSGLTKGTEFTFFAAGLDYPITFTTGSPAEYVISENGYLSMYGTGSAVTAKQIGSGPVVWALIGSLKA